MVLYYTLKLNVTFSKLVEGEIQLLKPNRSVCMEVAVGIWYSVGILAK